MSSDSSLLVAPACVPSSVLSTRMQVLNLLDGGFPSAKESKKRLEAGLARSRAVRAPVLKLIHGFGANPNIQVLRRGIRKYLRHKQHHGDIHAYVPGESWAPYDVDSLELIQRVPEAIADIDFGQENRGITLVLL